MNVSGSEVSGCAPAPPSNWYAIYTKHHHEKNVSDLLAKKDFEVFLPLYESMRRWKDRKKKVLLPIFPCYVFLRAGLARRLEVMQTPGVFFFVESGGRAATVQESEIEAIRLLTSSPVGAEPCAYIERGDLVRVRTGPLSGLHGILTRIKNQDRVVVSVALLRRSVSAEVDISCVDLVRRQSEGAAVAGMQ